jgi:ParB/RepB/Spo0J family partition protein
MADIAPEDRVPFVVGMINVALIRESKVALRAVNRQSEKYLMLVESIRRQGILNPIVVREVKDPVSGKIVYGLVDGLHRFTASKDAGLLEVPAHVTKLDDRELLEAQIIANIHKVDTKPVEYTKQMMRILAGNPLMTRRELAGRLAQTEAWISQRLNLLKLDPKIQELVDTDKVNLSNAYALAKLPTDEQVDFVDRAMTDTPQVFVPSVYNRVKEIKDAKQKGQDAAPAEFTPTIHLQKLSDVKKMFESPEEMAGMICDAQGASNALDGFKAAIAWCLHMDDLSIRSAKVDYEARKSKREEEVARRKAEREEKKRAEAAAKAADLTSL